MSSRKELGKGIRALLHNMDAEESKQMPPSKEVVKELSHTFIDIPIDQIEPNPFQPRQEFDETELNALADSLKLHGLIQPITVRRLSAKEYQLISGERRLRAAKIAGLEMLPAYIRIADDQGLLEMALIENIQRRDLNAVEVAISYQRLIEECQLTHEVMASRVGKDRSTVTNYLRLLKLPASVQQAVREQKISMGHARVLVGLEDPVRQIQLVGEIIQKGLSVRETERLATPNKGASKTGGNDATKGKVSAELQRIENDLSSALGTRVKLIRDTKGKGKIVIPFGSDDALNEILDRIENG
jgi:ParB family transcriptional regulator, chromosome partitioning protein